MEAFLITSTRETEGTVLGPADQKPCCSFPPELSLSWKITAVSYTLNCIPPVYRKKYERRLDDLAMLPGDIGWVRAELSFTEGTCHPENTDHHRWETKGPKT